MPHFMIVLIVFKPFLDDRMSIFEEYGAFNDNFGIIGNELLFLWIFAVCKHQLYTSLNISL